MRFLLYPLAVIYGFLIIVRNLLFDYGLLPSRSFNIPLIVVGNLSVGGTGKTPHIEYLIRLLRNDYRVVTLSRGYKRLSKGYIVAKPEHTSPIIGDEPLQMSRKFCDITVVVDEQRKRGIQNIIRQYPETGVILLDDAFQHRSVDAGLKIVLTDYHRLYTNDCLLPVGYLREPKSGIRRANIIIVTKTPQVLSPIDRRMITDSIRPETYQHLFFSFISYGDPIPLFPDINFEHGKPASALLVEGIANSYPLEDYLRRRIHHLDTIHFPDHYQYKAKDVQKIRENFTNIVGRNKVIYTTEKDAMRLMKPGLAEILSNCPVFYIPIEIKFHGDDEREYNMIIHEYVRENQRNR